MHLMQKDNDKGCRIKTALKAPGFLYMQGSWFSFCRKSILSAGGGLVAFAVSVRALIIRHSRKLASHAPLRQALGGGS